MDDSRRLWELGSDFHLMIPEAAASGRTPWHEHHRLTGSGRMALQHLLAFGAVAYGWRRLWIPSYYCQSVLPAMLRSGMEVRTYAHTPLESTAELPAAVRPKRDVILTVNFFGLWDTAPPGAIRRPEGVMLIEDHSHDPFSSWAFNSDADYCIASLRKTLPLPDGGVLWSAIGRSCPPALNRTDAHINAATLKLAGMTLKALYLTGAFPHKAEFRALLRDGESAMDSALPSSMSSWSSAMLATLPVHQWRETRRANNRYLQESLERVATLKMLPLYHPETAAPLASTILCASASQRSALRAHLIARNVYPAILWPQRRDAAYANVSREVSLSDRLLSVPCDMRYNESDMTMVGDLIAEWSKGGR